MLRADLICLKKPDEVFKTVFSYSNEAKKMNLMIKENEELEPKFEIPLEQYYFFQCPYCKEKLIFIDSNFKIKHFRHYFEKNCGWEPETEQHMKMKLICKELFNLKNENIEYNLKFAIPDLFIPEKNIAIEVQHSKIDYSKFIERTKNYTQNNIFVLWIFHEKLLTENPMEILKLCHKLYFGRIYVYKKEQIYPVHFERFGRWIEPNDFSEHDGYFKWYKNKRNFNFGIPISNFNFLKIQNEFKLARFYDKQFWKNKEEEDGN